MTRLREEDIVRIPQQLNDYDSRLKRMTGASLRQIACKAVGVNEASVIELLKQVRIASVPVRAGLGVIGGFSSAVAAIVSHLGCDSFVTERSDVAGIVEGIEEGAHILMLADDERFIALSHGGRHVVDNSSATALGFVSGLELMRGSLAGESVLMLGCGRVGMVATRALVDRGASVAVCDTKQDRALATLRDIGQSASNRLTVVDASRPAYERYDLIFDATDTGGFVGPAQLSPRSMVAAPGLPCALTPEAMAENRDRVLHDVLEIGTVGVPEPSVRDGCARRYGLEVIDVCIVQAERRQ
jgi:pyrrolysine biosynthesis protein PylD